MNREDIIRMAREAAQGMEGFTPKVKDPSGAVLEFYERFAALVASAEREACAEMVEPWLMPEYVEKLRNRGQA